MQENGTTNNSCFISYVWTYIMWLNDASFENEYKD